MPKTAYRVVDMHTAGEPVRIIVEGYPTLSGGTILDKRRTAQEKHDQIRRRLMLEPRGHADMYGVIPVPASVPEAAFGVLFTHNSGYSTMCGHATVAVGRWAVESGRVPAVEGVTAFKLECPCGPVDVMARVAGGKVREVTFRSVPAFTVARDHEVAVPGAGKVKLDIAYGGAYYGILPASAAGLNLFSTPLPKLVAAATAITDELRASLQVKNDESADLAFIYGTIFTDDETPTSGKPTHNLCVFGEGQIDRSPTGSGVTARMALDYSKGLIGAGVSREFRGASGQGFVGKVDAECEAGSRRGVRVLVSGQSYYTGRLEFVVEEDDPLKDGFTPSFQQDAR